METSVLVPTKLQTSHRQPANSFKYVQEYDATEEGHPGIRKIEYILGKRLSDRSEAHRSREPRNVIFRINGPRLTNHVLVSCYVGDMHNRWNSITTYRVIYAGSMLLSSSERTV